jgi:ribonucleotide reductase alpha subunit
MRAFDQGGRRLGSAAMYLMLHHADIMEFLQLRKPTGEEINRARDLFYAVWIPDIFMERVKNNEDWSLFDPANCWIKHNGEIAKIDLGGLYDKPDSKDYSNAYVMLEAAGRAVKTVPARQIWNEILETNRLTGMPYICFSDNANRQSNQQNLGTIRSSNLCAEIYEYSDLNETAVCNLCSINLERCVIDTYDEKEDKSRRLDDEYPVNPRFDFDRLVATARVAVRNLNQVIDKTFYPTEKTQISNIRHRPIGIGVQGLANVFLKMRYSFESEEARMLNKQIFETLQYGCYTESAFIARDIYMNAKKKCQEEGTYVHITYKDVKISPDPVVIEYRNPQDIPYEVGSYPSMLWGSQAPISRGIFSWELAGLKESDLSGMWDWNTHNIEG